MTIPKLRVQAVIALAALAPARATEVAWTQLPVIERVLPIEAIPVRIVLRPEVRLTPASQQFLLEARSSISLSDLQTKAAAIVNAAAQRISNCDSRWSFPSFQRPDLAEGRLRLSGRIRFEKWPCALPARFRPRQDADFVVALSLARSDTEIRLVAKLEAFDLRSDLVALAGLEDDIVRALQREIDKRLAEVGRFSLPEPLLAFKPSFTAAEINARDGEAELLVSASAHVSPADIPTILNMTQSK